MYLSKLIVVTMSRRYIALYVVMDLDCTSYHNLLSSWDDGTKSNDRKVWWIWIDRGLNEDDIKKNIKFSSAPTSSPK